MTALEMYGTEAALLPDLGPVIAESAYPLLFATVSGAHLYGFPSRDSDVDLRGVHLVPIGDLVGLSRPGETVSRMWGRDGVEMDLVTHDVAKFARLLLRPNGYVLEQLLSPLVAHSTAFHAELVELAPRLATSGHGGHYRGFAATQWRLFGKSGQLKPLLYTYRTLLTGIHLMQSGEVLAHLPTLAQAAHAPRYLPELIAVKAEAEHGCLDTVDGAPDRGRLADDVASLVGLLEDARERTHLPGQPGARPAIGDLIVRARLAHDTHGWGPGP